MASIITTDPMIEVKVDCKVHLSVVPRLLRDIAEEVERNGCTWTKSSGMGASVAWSVLKPQGEWNGPTGYYCEKCGERLTGRHADEAAEGLRAICGLCWDDIHNGR